MKGRLGESRLAFCSDSTKPQMIGKMLNRATRNTAGRTKAQPARLSECQMRCARLGRAWRRASDRRHALAAGERRVHLLRRVVERRLGLGLPEHHLNDRGAHDLC